MKKNRYVMGWSQADHAWEVCYAPSLEEAESLYEDGEVVLEPETERARLSAREILKKRDGLSERQVDAAIRETREVMILSDPNDALEILCEELGLESEHLEEVLCV